VYLGPTSKGGEDEKHMLIYLADMSKLRSGIHNAIKWLHAKGLGDPESKKNWIFGNIERYGNKKTLNYFGRNATKEFRNAWVHVKEFTAFDTMEKYKALIPYKIQNHVKLILEGKQGLFVASKEVILKDDIVWNMEFTYVGERGTGLKTSVKIGGSIFSEATEKMGSSALWVFDCCKGLEGHFWIDMEYKTIMGKISEWMGNIGCWNGIFMLPTGENADMVIILLGVKTSPGWHIIKGDYQFGPQLQASGQIIKDGNRVIARYKPIGTIIYVLHHPPTAFVADNFAKKVKQLDSIFIEPRNGWDMCTKYRDARCPVVVDEIISSYYQSDSWIIIGYEILHMIHTLAGKTPQLVLFESDQNMGVWLRKWKKKKVDGVQLEDGEEELWKDQEEESSDTSKDSEDDSRDSDSEDEANSLVSKRQRLALIQVKEQQKGNRLNMATNLQSSFRNEENSSQHSTVIASTPAPMQTEISEDGRTYSFLPDIGLWFDGMAWYEREEIPNDEAGREASFKFVPSSGPTTSLDKIHHPRSRISYAIGLHPLEEGQVNAGVAAAMEFVDGALIHPGEHPSWSLEL
jgi:hypothetical protein